MSSKSYEQRSLWYMLFGATWGSYPNQMSNSRIHKFNGEQLGMKTLQLE